MYTQWVIKMKIEYENEIRKQRGMQIAKTSRIMHREKGGYIVPSQSGSGAYIVRYENYKPVCECPDYEKRSVLGIKCKHCWAVEISINKKLYPDGTVEITKTVRKTYSQEWSAYNQAQTHEAELFMKLLHDLTENISKPRKFGRPSLNLGESIFCSALKVYGTLSSRRTVGDFQTALDKGYISHKPHFNAVSKLLNKEELTPVLMELIQVSSLPLKSVETDFAIDSSGFGTSRFDRWYSFKYGKGITSRNWLKAHVVCGVKTNVITAVKITDGHANDCPQFSELVNATANNFTMKEVSADPAYLSAENMKIVDDLDATAFIPFKSNSISRSRHPKIWRKMFYYFNMNRDEFLNHYHKRSNAETVFHMIKSKFGDSVRSKNRTAQVNEILLKILCHNICVVIQEMFELKIEANFCTQSAGLEPKVGDSL